MLAAWALGLASAAAGQSGAVKKVDYANLGPAVGAQMPEFSGQDQDGKVRNLKSLLGPKGGLVLVFRSADW